MMSQEVLIFFSVIIFTLYGDSHQQEQVQCALYATEASIREFPYFAAIDGCGAAILSDKWLITAAHCVEDLILYPGKAWVGGEKMSNSKQITYKKVIIHPQYTSNRIEEIPYNDIALLELSERLKFTDKIKPIKIADRTNGRDLLFAGKGIDETGRLSKSLKKLELKWLPTEECVSQARRSFRKVLNRHLEQIETQNICTRRTEDKPALCMGDSGSPLIQNNKLVGLASYNGHRTCSKTRLNFFTNVLTYASWIKSVTRL